MTIEKWQTFTLVAALASLLVSVVSIIVQEYLRYRPRTDHRALWAIGEVEAVFSNATIVLAVAYLILLIIEKFS